MKEQPTTLDQVREIISQRFGIEMERIQPKAQFTQDLGFDSLDCVELFMHIEEEYGIDITDEDSANLGQVYQLVEFIDAECGN